MTPTTDSRLDRLEWLLEGLLKRTPGTRHALLLSKDGLGLCRTSALGTDNADRLAAIAAGLQSLLRVASERFGDGSGGVRQAMAEFHGGILFVVEAGDGAHLAVVTVADADPGLVGHSMAELAKQIGGHLGSPHRDGV